VGFALLDANMHGLTVMAHLIDMDAPYFVRALEDAQIPQAVFALCENEGLTQHIVAVQQAHLKVGEKEEKHKILFFVFLSNNTRRVGKTEQRLPYPWTTLIIWRDWNGSGTQ
jgi:hypothetical protein